MAAIGANASTWKMHNYYVTSKVQNIFDTGGKVYYLNSGHLFRFDKSTGITDALNKQNLLSGNRISQIYYDWENRLLFIAYADANIDVINSEGKVTNIPNLKDRVTTVQSYTLSDGELSAYTAKGIRDITFANGSAYVAVGYGFFIIDEATLKVTKNYQFTRTISINSVVLVGETLMLFSNGRCYYGAPGDPEPTKNYESITGSFTGAKSYPINDNSVFVYGVSSGILKLDISSGTPVSSTVLSNNKATNIQKTTTGFIGNFAGQTYYYSFDQNGGSPTKQTSVVTCASSDPLGDGTIWYTDANGLQAVKLTFDSGILFATNKATLNANSKAALDQCATLLKNNADCDIAIYGHTDNTGSDAINNPLSVNRAKAVNTYLLGKGVSASQIRTVDGQGSTNPVADNSTAAGRQQNRRVEIYMYASQAMIQAAENGTLK